MKVIFTPQFKLWLKNYPKADQIKIGLFVEHVKQFGLNNLQGRNKSSDNVPTDDPIGYKKSNMPKPIACGITISAYLIMQANLAT
ncbi:Uncharacterised protein [Moraxella caprae]|uniref:Uncharacterized protein n=1 Tax=Moraxella caprae TaxID=90240 RepID=A0A378R1T1_9GAMM|nr:hypothetical protein [Moraxella caprae]STZ09175.1 Uncharacterised protein [Moraxella caprae]